MDQIAWDEEQIFSLLEKGGMALTVNKRLTLNLVTLYDERLRVAGASVWAAPLLMPVNVWLENALTKLGEDWRLLNDLQARQLWERIISSDGENDLLQLSRTARMANDAYRLAEEYQLDVAKQPLNEDQRAWLRWRKEYRQKLQSGSWLDSSSAWKLVLNAIQSERIKLPAETVLLGFDELNPHLMRLAECGATIGRSVLNMPPTIAPRGELMRVPCADSDDEVRRAARWTRRLLDSGAENIGIIVPTLESYRPRIERIFRAELDPESLLTPAHDPHGFNLSLGRPLIEQGPIAAAFDILQLEHTLSMEDISRLLRSPYFSRGHELTSRAQLDRNLRGLRRTHLNLSAVTRLAAKNQGRWRYSHAPGLAKRGKALNEFIGNRQRLRPGDWINPILQVLTAAGWPGKRGLDSTEYQALSSWRDKLLPALASLDFVSGAVDRRTAVSLLRRLAQETIFQTEGSSGPVQVLGVLEASGLRFDHLWVMGLTADVIPEAARPNPFLPIRLQSQLRLPHADAERELVFAEQVMGRLFAAAPQVVVSHPQGEGGKTLRPSSLIESIPEGTPELAPTHDPCVVFHSDTLNIEKLSDERGTPLPADKKSTGGTAILKDQALCPFRAFAHHRLHAKDFDRPEIGLDAMQRGSLVHACLEEAWKRLRDSATLQNLSEDELDALVVASVSDGVNNELERMPEQPGDRLLEVERRRLVKLVGRWLRDVERSRPEFKVVALEQAQRETVGDLTFQVKADRIDRLADGRKFIIDYKTGQVQGADLVGERLLEPQLPIYALNIPLDELAGVAFGSLRGGETRFVGIAAEKDLVPGVPGIEKSRIAAAEGIDNWETLVTGWRERLEKLATDFCAGEARVSPVNRMKACRYCDLADFCRIDEIGGLDGVYGEEER